MGKKYKIVISSGNIHREAELPDDDISIRVGTTVRCDIRIALLATKEPVELVMSRLDGAWSVECPEGLYFTDGGVRKQIRKQLDHGDKVFVFLQSQAKSICTIDFMLDFDSRAKKYDRMIDIRNVNNLVIGGHPTAAIYIEDPLLETDFITIAKRQGKLYLADFNARYGAYINGVRVDGEKELTDTDFFSVVSYSFYYKDGFLYTDSKNGIRINGLRSSFDSLHSDNMEYPKFVRNVRKKIILSKEPIVILDPEQKPQKPKNNIFMQLLPAVGSLILVVLLRGVMGGGGSFVIFSACSMALGMVTTVISFITGNKDYKKEVEKREKDYAAYIAGKRKEIEAVRKTEALQLSQIYIPVQQQLKRVREFSGDLFDRQREDDDFLCIRLGEGRQEAKRPIKITVKETITAADELAKIPQTIAQNYKYIPNAPVFIDLKADNAIGVVGDDVRQREMLKIMTLDISVRHYHNDVKLMYILGNDVHEIQWLRWLPHVSNEAMGVRNIVCDDESKNALFEFLYVELTSREQQKRNSPHYVVFVLDDHGMKRHPISEYISKAKSLGFTFVFFEVRQELLPQGVDEVVSLERGSNRATVVTVANLNNTRSFSYSVIKNEDMEKVALTLSPVYSEEVSLENTLTKSITLFEMLGILSPEDIDLNGNWSRAAVHHSLAVPIGVKANNETVYLDIRKHGPHGLVAGTTGAGKSELLQSYIISASILFHPYEVSFVIIDFKGGGMVNQLRELPHLIGAITNIDGREIDRSLKSIKAELMKRQRLFAEMEVSKIGDYIRKYKSGEASVPLPHLVIIVDEFAELKAEQPEFMKELISAARIGRSLGVHLILATQKPAGQVNEQIWSNSNFKMCLRVASPQDSNEVLKSPLAAEIREPGRAYLQVGNNEIFDLFQSAYSGGPSSVDAGEKQKTFSVAEVSLFGKRSIIFQRKPTAQSEGNFTQLEAVVNYVADFCQKQNISKLPDICLPSLPAVLPYKDEQKVNKTETFVTIGLYDDPDNQLQAPVRLNLTSGNVFIVGSSQSGKTNLLQTIIRGLVENYSPDELTLYVVDFSSMILKNFEHMKHVGGVVTRAEDEALKNLFKLMIAEIASRKDKLLKVGVSSYASYREAGLMDIPQIVLAIDNMTALKEMLGQDEEVLRMLCQEGTTVGISVVAANTQTTGFGYKYLAYFPSRIALFCNDSAEYSTVFDYCRMRPLNTPGRGLVQINKSIYEAQVYLAFEGEKEIERVREVRNFAERINQKYVGQGRATKIPVIPKVLTDDIMNRQIESLGSYQIGLGLDYATVEPVVLNLAELGLLGISGRKRMGRSNFIRHMLAELERNCTVAPVSVHIVDGMDKKFASLERLSIVEEYTLIPETVLETIAQWDSILQQRYEMLLSGDADNMEQQPLLLLIIRNNDVASIISSNSEALARYKNFLGKYKALKVCVIFADMDNVSIPFNAPEAVKPLRESHHFLFFDNLASMKLFDAPIAAIRQFKKDIEPGDCYYTRENVVRKIKTVLYEQ